MLRHTAKLMDQVIWATGMIVSMPLVLMLVSRVSTMTQVHK